MASLEYPIESERVIMRLPTAADVVAILDC